MISGVIFIFIVLFLTLYICLSESQSMTELRTIIEKSVLPQNIKNSITTFFSTPVQLNKIEKKNVKESDIRFSIHPPSDYFETLKNPNSNCQNEIQSKFRPSESEYAVCPWKQLKKKERQAQDNPKNRTKNVLQTQIIQIKPVQIKANLVAPELPKIEDLQQQAPIKNKPEITPPPESNLNPLTRGGQSKFSFSAPNQAGEQPQLNQVAPNQAGGQPQLNQVAPNQIGGQSKFSFSAPNQIGGQPQLNQVAPNQAGGQSQFSFSAPNQAGGPSKFSFGSS